MKMRSCFLIEIFALTATLSVSQVGPGIQQEAGRGGKLHRPTQAEYTKTRRYPALSAVEGADTRKFAFYEKILSNSHGERYFVCFQQTLW
jgi:hypothetical protein